MGWPQPQPEVVQAALDWLRGQDPRLSLDALANQLRAAGYPAPEVSAAVGIRQTELDAALPPGTDLRGRAAAILIVVFLVTWGTISLALVTGTPQPGLNGVEVLGALILGGVLLPLLLLGLGLIRASGRLRRGVVGALAWVFAIPIIGLVVLGGTCVAIYQPWT